MSNPAQIDADGHPHDTDAEWEKWGARDPYFGVLTHDCFRLDRMSAAAHHDFFETGRGHVLDLLTSCRRYFGSPFDPKRVLDFGCGVGRLLIPFAEVSSSVVGLDISESMLAEARRNCARFDVTNVELVRSDNELSAATGKFDLVHSAIVLQHIESERGLDIIAHLVGLVGSGGVVAIHVTYGRGYGRCHYGRVIPDPPAYTPPPRTLYRRLRTGLGQLLWPRTAEKVSVSIDTHAAPRDPEMLIYHYDLSRIAFILQSAGATELYAQFTNHGGELGAMLFARVAAPTRSHGDPDKSLSRSTERFVSTDTNASTPRINEQ